jgi:Zn-dependent peptidase ImmA (M78 family)
MTPNAISKLRDLVPLRPLSYSEALRIAELQAQSFLALSGIVVPAVPSQIISELPRIRVSHLSPFPTSGASHWFQGQWLVVVNASEPITRQRFSLAHEFKHILDHRFVKLIYSSLPDKERCAMTERICDYFAGCLLMPRPWVKSLYCSGIQDVTELARHFAVSPAAMAVRLNQIGLAEPAPRCLPLPKDWATQLLAEINDRPIYQRVTSYVT